MKKMKSHSLIAGLAVALGLSAASYVLFARVLQLSLPAGLLAGWL